jgi:hypothetical protein
MRFNSFRAFLISRCSFAMLAAIDLHDEAVRVAGKVRNVSADPDLPTEVSAGRGKSVAQVPPELPFGFRWRGSHLPREFTLRRRLRAIRLGPDSRFVACGHRAAS